jgi:hypothetical protein
MGSPLNIIMNFHVRKRQGISWAVERLMYPLLRGVSGWIYECVCVHNVLTACIWHATLTLGVLPCHMLRLFYSFIVCCNHQFQGESGTGDRSGSKGEVWYVVLKLYIYICVRACVCVCVYTHISASSLSSILTKNVTIILHVLQKISLGY